MKQKRLLCSLMCLMFAISGLTACNDSSSQPDSQIPTGIQETTGITSETNLTGSVTSGISSTTTFSEPAVSVTESTDAVFVPSDDMQYNEAYSALDNFLKACTSANRESALSLSNLRTAYTAAEQNGAQGVSFKQKADGKFQDMLGMQAVKIGQGACADTLKSNYLEWIPDLKKQIAASADDPQKQAELKLKSEIWKPIEMLYVFPVSYLTIDGVSVSELCYVIRTESTWSVDLAVLPDAVQEKRSEGIKQVAADARNFFLALSSALMDVQAMGADLTMADGVFYYRGADLGWGQMPETFDNAVSVRDAVNIRLGYYFSGLSQCDQIGYAINGGQCKAVAVQRGSENDPLTDTEIYYFGCYPHVLNEEDLGEYISIEDVMTHALG